MLTIEMLPASYGDCIWIKYGNPVSPSQVLIDAGLASTYKDQLKPRLKELQRDQRKFDLIVATHIDNDHIAGMEKLLKDRDRLGLKMDDFWYNALTHLPKKIYVTEAYSVRTAEKLSSVIEQKDLPPMPWNVSTDQKAVMRDGLFDLPCFTLAGGARITILGPTRDKLIALRDHWETALEDDISNFKEFFDEAALEEAISLESYSTNDINIESLAYTPFNSDTSVPNGSSISLLFEFNGKSILLAGDAHDETLRESISALAEKRGKTRLNIDAFKLSHHGSQKNLSKELIELISCKKYLISSNGNKFNHPDAETLARIIKFGATDPELIFNYESDFTKPWLDDGLQNHERFTAKVVSGKSIRI
ncbi:ComEC/Rec2 family competence protein [Terasakiella pusilla]|uniref:ComEC/Rec2 family competence protein n=1 Tax=Terasakiella pusilla TaxID=64973 RepID=UPI003AA9E198